MTNEDYKLTLKDCIPIYGLFNYNKGLSKEIKEKNNSDGVLNESIRKILLMSIYNSVIVVSTGLAIFNGLEKLLK